MTAAMQAKHHAFSGALTMPHHRFQTAEVLRTAISLAFQKLQAGAPWLRMKQGANFVGWVRALEVTHGRNGWHPHIHLVAMFAAGTPIEKIEAFGVLLFERWSRIIASMGFGECNPEVWQWEPLRNAVEAGDYLVKWGADRELTYAHMKIAKGGGRSPWQLLEDAMNGDRQAAALFREYALAFKGARQLTYSRGFREVYGLREALDDVEAASCDEVEERNPVIATLTRKTWHALRSRRLVPALLRAVEACPAWETIRDFLKRWGIVPDGQDGSPPRPGGVCGVPDGGGVEVAGSSGRPARNPDTTGGSQSGNDRPD